MKQPTRTRQTKPFRPALESMERRTCLSSTSFPVTHAHLHAHVLVATTRALGGHRLLTQRFTSSIPSQVSPMSISNTQVVMPLALNSGVLSFAQSKLGSTVGDGECATLAVSALDAAGARSRFAPSDPDADYVWGDLVATLTPSSHSPAGIEPGDVIQFRDVSTLHVAADGSWTSQTAGHHTAIVAAVNGNTISVLQQNNNGVKAVQAGTWALDDLKAGTLWVYRPIAA